MSKQLVSAISNLHYHTQELKCKVKAIHEARQDMIRYPNTPKHDLIVSALLPKLERELAEEKERVQHWAGELAKAQYTGHEDFEEWYS